MRRRIAPGKDFQMSLPAFENSYAGLPGRYFVETPPAPVAAPALIRLNRPLASLLGLDADWLQGPEGVAMLSGSAYPEPIRPVALAYAGHQFGQFVPQLGDGRAVLLGEVVGRDGRRRDIQLKGSGQTAFSRGGDGRSALGPVLREYVVSEAMAALGIPTTRSLAAVATGETVYRDRRLPGAVLARVAASHLRIGTFQFFAARGDEPAIRALADMAIARHYPDCAGRDRPHLAFYEAVVAAQAQLVARWMLVGFIHGVMNTDNMAISGETIDYGPCAFMDEYDPAKVFSSIDQFGRYAFANQPAIAQWNLARLAETMLPLLADDRDEAVAAAEQCLSGFAPRFEAVFREGMRRKLGLLEDREGDVELARELLDLMATAGADFTVTFRALSGDLDVAAGEGAARLQFPDPSGFDAWSANWRSRLALESAGTGERRSVMDAANPAYIPRNHLIEELIEAAVDRQDFGPFEEMLDVVSRPFEEQPGRERHATPPSKDERVLRTFCGT
jgi:uncharacterized protein YdiU (UPF0061 family)